MGSINHAANNRCFTAAERVKDKILIEELFKKGSSFVVYPYKIFCLQQPQAYPDAPTPVQVLVSVPKRRFKRAVDRNLLRRRIKEAYRNAKVEKEGILLHRQKNVSSACAIAILYIGKDILPYKYILSKLKAAFRRL